MRIPDSAMSGLLRSHLQSATERLSRLQLEVASGIRIQRPADDPSGAAQAGRLRNSLEMLAGYQKANTDAHSWLANEDAALGGLQETLRQIRTLTVQAGTPQSPETQEALAAQIEGLGATLLRYANSQDGERYLFAGNNTTTAPFSGQLSGVTYAGDAGARQVALGDGVSMTLNHSGTAVFNLNSAVNATQPDLFTSVATLVSRVRAGNQEALQASLADLDAHITRVSAVRAETGSRLQQVQLGAGYLAQSKTTLEGLLTDTEGTDITEAIVQLKEQENQLQAAGYVASTLARGGLLQWLR